MVKIRTGQNWLKAIGNKAFYSPNCKMASITC